MFTCTSIRVATENITRILLLRVLLLEQFDFTPVFFSKTLQNYVYYNYMGTLDIALATYYKY